MLISTSIRLTNSIKYAKNKRYRSVTLFLYGYSFMQGDMAYFRTFWLFEPLFCVLFWRDTRCGTGIGYACAG